MQVMGWQEAGRQLGAEQQPMHASCHNHQAKPLAEAVHKQELSAGGYPNVVCP
jgi:hypothetical protein